MPRTRSVKPEFFTDADLCELPPLHRLLFEGLWCHADREGRLEDKPRELKVRVLPYDTCDVDEMLWELHEAGFIARYVDGARHFIFITRFAEHQHPHKEEKVSVIPSYSVEQRREHGGSTAKTGGSTEETPHKRDQEEAITRVKTPGSWSLVSGPGSLSPGDCSPQPRPTTGLPPSVEAPTTPPEGWLGGDFWCWFQAKRQKANLVPEKWPNQRKLDAWWSAVRLVVQNVEDLKQAVYRFGDDPYWQKGNPPLPFNGFMDQWQKYMGQMRGRDAHA